MMPPTGARGPCALDGRAPDLATRILDLTRGRRVCASFDFVGSDATVALATTRAVVKVTHPAVHFPVVPCGRLGEREATAPA